MHTPDPNRQLTPKETRALEAATAWFQERLRQSLALRGPYWMGDEDSREDVSSVANDVLPRERIGEPYVANRVNHAGNQALYEQLAAVLVTDDEPYLG